MQISRSLNIRIYVFGPGKAPWEAKFITYNVFIALQREKEMSHKDKKNI